MEFKTLVGKTLVSVEGSKDSEEIVFTTSEGEKFRLYHEQSCCEHVCVEDICGDLTDLIGSPILQADEESKEAGEGEASESGTWTFYRMATIKGSVVIRWLGQSNGYYSESVSFEKC